MIAYSVYDILIVYPEAVFYDSRRQLTVRQLRFVYVHLTDTVLLDKHIHFIYIKILARIMKKCRYMRFFNIRSVLFSKRHSCLNDAHSMSVAFCCKSFSYIIIEFFDKLFIHEMHHLFSV